MKTRYTTQGTCARAIDIELLDNMIIKDVTFIGGCSGNTSGLSALLEGLPIDTVIQKLKSIKCRGNTSCPDQLAQALESLVLAKT